MVQALHPDRRVRVHRVPEAGAAVGAGAPGENLAQLVHHGAVVGAGRDVLDPHHLHHLSLLCLRYWYTNYQRMRGGRS